MATYKEIKGVTVQTRDEDPSVFVGSWAAGGDTNKSGQGRGSAGTQTSNLAFGGDSPNNDYVEEYNGTAWAETTDMNTGKTYGFGCGANAEAAMSSGGYTNPSGPWFTVTETWNGSSWTEVNDMNTARGDGGMFGVVPGSIAAGGYSGTLNTAVENWDGSSWTEIAELNTGRYYGCGIGTTNTAGLIVGGSTPSATAANESWNGSAWTELNDLNTARNRAGGSGTSTAGLAYSGAPFPKGNTESWDGTSWTEVADLATARYGVASSPSGTSSLALASGGYTTTQVSNTEEWSFPSSPILTEGDLFLSGGTTLKGFGRYAVGGAWASGGNMNNANAAVGSLGTSTAAIEFGGYYPPGSVPGRITVEEYNGTSWTEKNDMSTYRAERPGAGTTAAGLAIRGNPGNATAVESWDGTNWSTVNSSNTPNGGNSAGGTQTAAITFGGETTANTELWNGSTWTETADMNTARGKMSGSGIQTSAIGSGGTPGPAVLSESWNGTSWSEVAEINTPRSAGAAGGTSNSSALAFGGGPSRTANTELWNGSAWTEVANLSSATQDMNYGSVGSTGGTLAIGGDASPPVSTRTEEWTADNAVLTITTS